MEHESSEFHGAAVAAFRPLLWLGAAEVAELLTPERCLAAVEEGLRLLGLGLAPRPASCGLAAGDGGFHVKVAATPTAAGPRFVAKVNANFPLNPGRGLPTVQGVVVLMDGADGRPLALLDSGALTARRTAAATAVAARYLARRDASVATLCGCGVLGRAHLPALLGVLPLRKVFAVDPNSAAVAALARYGEALGVEVVAADLEAACAASDVVVTCTPSREFLLGAGQVREGTFVAGVGADWELKRELHPSLLAAATVVVDSREQCARMGDLHHALAAGAVAADHHLPELGEIVAGKLPGRTYDSEVIVFDSTGIAVEDVAAAIEVYNRALERGRGVALGESPAAWPEHR
jgi:alanine dehydrogenase